MANNLNWLGSRMAENNSTQNYSNQQVQTPVQVPSTQAAQPNQAPQPIQLSQEMAPQPAPMPYSNQVPPVMDIEYIQGYLNSILGKKVRAEFMLGGNQYMDKAGRLVEVGVNYFVLEDFISQALIMCDLYSVKFVTTI